MVDARELFPVQQQNRSFSVDESRIASISISCSEVKVTACFHLRNVMNVRGTLVSHFARAWSALGPFDQQLVPPEHLFESFVLHCRGRIKPLTLGRWGEKWDTSTAKCGGLPLFPQRRIAICLVSLLLFAIPSILFSL